MPGTAGWMSQSIGATEKGAPAASVRSVASTWSPVIARLRGSSLACCQTRKLASLICQPQHGAGVAPASGGAAHTAMRIILWATFAKPELVGRLQALVGEDLTVVASLAELGAAIAEADALVCPDFLYSAQMAQTVRE